MRGASRGSRLWVKEERRERETMVRREYSVVRDLGKEKKKSSSIVG